MASPEMPYLAAGAIALIGGAVKEKGFPANGIVAVMATIFLVIIVSMTANTKIAPLLHAIGMLLLLGSVMGTLNMLGHNTATKTNPRPR